ncbi:hypothetical protein A2911_01670 [Candidatus Nomurabacteria bacterium RIFCSPLOWO2_01_FULL_40_15]|uniref:DUF5673 domain-containing protein n=1 Tax=Candidatus Nomurabacteria bacterium RIFCSPLOWO2_01_FULL_40_15 TaxID=1801772 RepID=A0A1F6X8D0_9BACT|nr:MAG: hypothetical protein A2911_01670 [Candidatus Nomurabacteria bacterium RIFCSPLOWO2_01_FULL_40_15]
MNPIEKLEWTALEYEDKERSKDWFWALGVIIVTAGATSIIFGNYFFAILIVLGGTLLGFFATKKPNEVLYELNEKGLRVGTRLFPYENIKSFWVETESPENKTEVVPTLFIKSERFFMPIISIPLKHNMVAEIHDVFIFNNIPEEEMREHISDHIMRSLGF